MRRDSETEDKLMISFSTMTAMAKIGRGPTEKPTSSPMFGSLDDGLRMVSVFDPDKMGSTYIFLNHNVFIPYNYRRSVLGCQGISQKYNALNINKNNDIEKRKGMI